MKLTAFLFIFFSLQAWSSHEEKVIHCSPGLTFSATDQVVTIKMDQHPFEHLLAPYFKQGTYSYYKTGLIWSKSLNSFYVKDRYSTVHIFKYFKRRAIRLVAHRKGYPTLSLQFEDCRE